MCLYVCEKFLKVLMLIDLKILLHNLIKRVMNNNHVSLSKRVFKNIQRRHREMDIERSYSIHVMGTYCKRHLTLLHLFKSM